MSSAEAEERELAKTLRLRGAPPGAVKLSRRAVVLTAGVGAAALAGVVGWSLSDHAGTRAAPEMIQADPARPPDQLVALPKDYAGERRVPPELGPPAFTPVTVGASASVASAPGPSPLGAPLFAGGGAASAPAVLARQAAIEDAGVAASVGPLLIAGTSIKAALVTGIRSDLPGPVAAQVTENVHDSLTGEILLVPQGSRLLGAYDHQVALGQERVLLTWDRLILPDGRSLDLGKAPATDAAGHAGLSGRVDRRWGELLGASLVSLGLSAGAVLGQSPSDDQILRALRTGGSDVATQVGAQVVGKAIDVRPRLTVRAGTPVRVLLTRDLVFEAPRRP